MHKAGTEAGCGLPQVCHWRQHLHVQPIAVSDNMQPWEGSFTVTLDEEDTTRGVHEGQAGALQAGAPQGSLPASAARHMHRGRSAAPVASARGSRRVRRCQASACRRHTLRHHYIRNAHWNGTPPMPGIASACTASALPKQTLQGLRASQSKQMCLFPYVGARPEHSWSMGLGSLQHGITMLRTWQYAELLSAAGHAALRTIGPTRSAAFWSRL